MVEIPGTPPVIGVIGGSGVYEIDGLTTPLGPCRNVVWGSV